MDPFPPPPTQKIGRPPDKRVTLNPGIGLAHVLCLSTLFPDLFFPQTYFSTLIFPSVSVPNPRFFFPPLSTSLSFTLKASYQQSYLIIQAANACQEREPRITTPTCACLPVYPHQGKFSFKVRCFLE